MTEQQEAVVASQEHHEQQMDGIVKKAEHDTELYARAGSAEIRVDYPLALRAMGISVFKCNVNNGWFEEDRDWGDDIALLHSEVAEMFEAYRDHGFKDVTRLVDVPCPDPQCGDSTWDHECQLGVKPGKPEGFASECADVLIRALDTDKRHRLGFGFVAGVEPEDMTLADVKRHPDFNPELSVGRHIARLHRLIARLDTDGMNGTGTLGHVLGYLLAWTDHLHINLQDEYQCKLAYNLTRGYRHGGKLL